MSRLSRAPLPGGPARRGATAPDLSPSEPVPASRAAALLPGVLREIVAAGREARITVTGSSMRPSLRDGDRVTIAPCDTATLRLGDVLLCERPEGGLTLHRLVRRGNGWLQTGGDARWFLDPRWPEDALLGRAVRVEREGRRPCAPARALGRLVAVASLARGIAAARLAAFGRHRGR